MMREEMPQQEAPQPASPEPVAVLAELEVGGASASASCQGASTA